MKAGGRRGSGFGRQELDDFGYFGVLGIQDLHLKAVKKKPLQPQGLWYHLLTVMSFKTRHLHSVELEGGRFEKDEDALFHSKKW